MSVSVVVGAGWDTVSGGHGPLGGDNGAAAEEGTLGDAARLGLDLPRPGAVRRGLTSDDPVALVLVAVVHVDLGVSHVRLRGVGSTISGEGVVQVILHLLAGTRLAAPAQCFLGGSVDLGGLGRLLVSEGDIPIDDVVEGGWVHAVGRSSAHESAICGVDQAGVVVVVLFFLWLAFVPIVLASGRTGELIRGELGTAFGITVAFEFA